MTDKQQTALQWLKEQLTVTYSPANIEWLWFKALEMEREQIKKAARWEPFLGDYAKEVGEQYYTDNYKTQDND